MKFYGLTKREIETVKSYNKNELDSKGIKAFKSNSDTITIETCNDKIEISIKNILCDRCSECLKVVDLEKAFIEKGFKMFYNTGHFNFRKIDIYSQYKGMTTNYIVTEIEKIEKAISSVKLIVEVELEFLNANIPFEKIVVSKMSRSINDYEITFGMGKIYVDYKYNIEKKDFSYKVLLKILKKELKKYKSELKRRNSFYISSKRISKLLK